MSSVPSAMQQQRSILSLVLVGVGALCLPAYLLQNVGGGGSSDERFGRRALQEELESDAEMYRLLSDVGDAQSQVEDLSIPEYLLHAGEEGHASAEEAVATAIEQASLKGHPQPENLPAYDIIDVLSAKKVFSNTYGILVYDNIVDEFSLLYSNDQKWVSGCTKLKMAFLKWISMLRKTFPDRFCGPECDEWMVGFSSGDYPHFHPNCLESFPHASEKCPRREAPVFQFGSAFKYQEQLPNMIAMPMPIKDMSCIEGWAAGNGVCSAFSRNEKELLQYKSKWEDLKTQLVWRGKDFGYLNHFSKYKTIDTGRPAKYEDDIPQDVRQMDVSMERRIAATRSMRENYYNLSPRWKAVVLTAEAEREHEMEVQGKKNDGANKENASLPWADMRFTGASPFAGFRGQKPQAYTGFADLGIQSIGASKNSQDLSTYKYHIDLGGGGGTTWTGTHTKLAMPGLLFHHVTPTKDYIHDRMTPWVHYVPVKADLSDLKEKYDWAEAHPEVAKRIAEQGTELMEHIATPDGYGELFQEDFVEPMRRVMEAYRPVSVTHPPTNGNAKLSWRQVLKQAQVEQGFAKYKVRIHCTGKSGSKSETCVEGGDLL